MNKIALIIPHFGNFKNYVDFWLETCRKNPLVDFLIFTDNNCVLDFINNYGGGEFVFI